MGIEPVNIFTVDLEDWFFTDDYTFDKSRLKDYEENLIKNTRTILHLLEETGNRATFFVLGKIAETVPNLLNDILDGGNEVASHGYNHRLLNAMNIDDFKNDIEKTNRAIYHAIGRLPIGYRAPNFTIFPDMFDILKDNGYKYDASQNLRWLRKELNNKSNLNLNSFSIYNYNLLGIKIPNCGGGYLRLYPYQIFKVLFNGSINEFGMRIFYLHPWDIYNSLDKKQVKMFNRFKNYYNSSSTIGKLEKLMEDYNFIAFEEYMKQRKFYVQRS